MTRIVLDRKPLRAKARYEDGLRINIISDANHVLSPPDALVKLYKHGEITFENYAGMYYANIQSAQAHLDKWVEELQNMLAPLDYPRVTLLCYCGGGKPCHTHLAIRYLLTRYPAVFLDGRDETSIPKELS